MYNCAFTGHRKIKYGHRAGLLHLLSVAVRDAYNRGCRRFIVGGAIGFDTEAAREVVRFRISHPDVTLALFLPCIDQSALWNESQRDSYDFLLSVADEIKYISESYDKDCMRRRNLAMAEECDLMIAYAGNSRSGSAQTVRMATLLGKEVINIYPELEEGSDR